MSTTTVSVEQITVGGQPTVALVAPYHPDLPARAKALGGRFGTDAQGRKLWRFDPRDEERVLALAREVYGTDGRTPVRMVTVRVTLPSQNVYYGDRDLSLWYEGRQLARAFGRNTGAHLGEGIILIEGGFGSGGSRNNPSITFKPGYSHPLHGQLRLSRLRPSRAGRRPLPGCLPAGARRGDGGRAAAPV